MCAAKLGLAALVATMVTAWLAVFGVALRFELPARTAVPAGGYMYVVAIPQFKAQADTNERPTRSRLEVFENGRPIGPAHTVHAEIIARGSGRFSHYDQYVYFSATDNSDVRTNGRAYVASHPWRLHRSVPIGLALLTVVLGARWASRLSFGRMAAMLCALPAWLRASTGHQRSGVLNRLALGALSATLLAAFFATSGIVQHLRLDSARATAAGGHMFAYELRKLESFADLNSDPFRSNLELFEDGRRLGPAHSMHADIMASGAGRFSHYGQYLYFSSSDNSNVTQNDRTYSIRYSTRLHGAVPAVLAALAAFLILLSARALAGGTYALARPGHIAQALHAAKAREVFFIAAALIVLHTAMQLQVAPDLAAQDLDLLRRGARRIVSLLVGVLGGGAVVLRARSQQPLATLGQLLFLVVLGGAMSTDFVLFTALVAVGGIIGIVARRWLPASFTAQSRAWGRELTQIWASDPRRMVWRVGGAASALTVVNVVPEVVQYWDQSGWMDSRFYDIMAHDIARGAAPFGNSEYAPLYQYTMGALYWTFGHFYFVQQVANVALACLTAVCLCWAAWLLFSHLAAVVAAGLFVAYWSPLHHAVWYTQIENLYVPLFAASILGLALYLQRRSSKAAALLALTAALVFCTRQQSAFYIVALGLAFLVVPALPLRERLRHAVLFGVLFALIGLLPWSLRNLQQEGRFTPSSRQSTAFLAIFNDPRIPFHAIRYWERSREVGAEWVRRYPDPIQREAAMRAYFRDRLLNETGYFVSAAPWRLAAFYGMLPGAYLGADWTSERVVTFADDWLPHLQTRYDLWIPVVLSLLALAGRWRNRTAWLILALVGSNVVVGLLVGSAEPRNCYPVLLLHALLATALVRPFAIPAVQGSEASSAILPVRGATIAAGIVVTVVVAIVIRFTLGAQHEYRSLPNIRYVLRSDTRIDESLPRVTYTGGRLYVDGQLVDDLEAGKRYRARFVLSAYMFPPRYMMKGLPGLEPSLAYRDSVQYYSAFLDRWNVATPLNREASLEFPLRYDGAVVPVPLREHQVIDAEFKVEQISDATWAAIRARWSLVEKAVVVSEPGR